MRSVLAQDNPAVVRAALIRHLARALAPLFQSRNLRDDLADWVAPLPTVKLVDAIHADANETAEALAAAILSDTVRRHPNDAFADLIAVEFPRITDADRARLIDFTAAVRRIAFECDGVVEDRQLVEAGFPSSEHARHMPRAKHVIAILNGACAPTRSPAGTPAGRLIEAGVRAATRHASA